MFENPSDFTVRIYEWQEIEALELDNLSSTYKCNFLGADNKQ